VSSNSEFIRYLYDLTHDERSDGKGAASARAALAGLRRGRGKVPGTVVEMYSLVVPELRQAKPWEQQAWVDETYFLIAALFAGHRFSREHDIERPPPNLGASLRKFVEDEEEKHHPVGESTGKRFAALLECDRNELPVHLRHAVNLLNDTPIDWATLLDDILRWDAEKRTQLRWAKAYWYRPPAKPKDDESETERPGDDAALAVLEQEGD